MLHDDQGHEAIERTLSLLCEHFYWSKMYVDATSWVQNCNRFKIANGPYVDPNPIQGSLMANNLLDLVCLDFIKVDPSWDGKENVLVIMDAFSKFTVVTPN